MQIQIDLRVANFEIPQHLWQTMQTDVVAGGETQAARRRLLLAAQAGAVGLQFLQDALGVRFEQLAVRRQNAALADPIEQFDPDVVFELTNSYENYELVLF
jgi:hypothetical protein